MNLLNELKIWFMCIFYPFIPLINECVLPEIAPVWWKWVCECSFTVGYRKQLCILQEWMKPSCLVVASSLASGGAPLHPPWVQGLVPNRTSQRVCCSLGLFPVRHRQGVATILLPSLGGACTSLPGLGKPVSQLRLPPQPMRIRHTVCTQNTKDCAPIMFHSCTYHHRHQGFTHHKYTHCKHCTPCHAHYIPYIIYITFTHHTPSQVHTGTNMAQHSPHTEYTIYHTCRYPT